jgi:sodium-dependent dicarboxylate transporter 2/3/5
VGRRRRATALLLYRPDRVHEQHRDQFPDAAILVSVSKAAELDPRLLMLPCTVAASCGFALPIGTPPNTVVFATGKVRVRDMVLPGIVLDLFGAAFLSAWIWLVVVPVLGIVTGAPR